jgi:hypothetical protein
MLLAIFLLVLMAGMGIALHALGRNELFMSSATQHSKQVYFLAESGVEASRQVLFVGNTDGAFDDDLDASAGADGTIDFDPETVRPVYDSAGSVTGFSGYDDDLPLVDVTAFGSGWYAAFLTNDPANTGGTGSLTDDNDRVMITAVGAGRDGSFEVVQAIVEPAPLFPADLPATITIFGENPTFVDGDDVNKRFVGDDCDGSGIAGFNVPVAGLIGTPAESVVEGSLSSNTVYTSEGQLGHVTVVDLTDATDPGIAGILGSDLGTIDPAWIDCQALHGMALETRDVADVVCVEGTTCTLPPSAPDRIVFADGDFSLTSSMSGAGLLWVTGRLTMSGSASWSGIIMVVGEGEFVRTGGGSAGISGATTIADIAGPDNVFGTVDDCTGGSDGFHPAVYDESAGGTGDTVYCNADVLGASPITRYPVVEFRQM